MRVEILGPLSVTTNEQPIEVGGPRIRRLLLALVVANGSIVQIDTLIDAVWADGAPPDGARRTLMSYVSRLRTSLPDLFIEQNNGGYQLHTSGIALDTAEFAELLSSGLRSADAGDVARALTAFNKAVDLWRGEPFAEYRGEQWIEADRLRLNQTWAVLNEARFAAMLDLGHHGLVLDQIESVAGQFPDHERLDYLQILALYRAGRQTEALRQFQAVREQLAESGLNPSPELAKLERQILTHDDALSQSRLQPGTKVRGYELGKQIGEGAFGAIYVAVQSAIDREVAIKVIRPDLANDPRFIQRFEVEAQLVARLEHPHIVPLYDYWREPGGAYLVMRWLRGNNAEERLVTDGPMSVADVSRVVEQIGGALAAAHARGVIHRDVKPANILFDEDGAAYLADFGIAVDRGHDHDTSADDLLSAGSPLYVSPEQVAGAETSVQSDIYSLGVVVYELLVGHSAFSADSVQELLQKKLTAVVPSVRPQRPDVPAAVDAVIAKATAVNPDERFQNMGDLVLSFRAAFAALGLAATTGGQSTSARDFKPRAAANRTLMSVELELLNPYKGLRAFEKADKQDFFGREALVDELINRVNQNRFVAVVGASGSGKSSAVRAGVLSELGRDGRFVVTIVPGTHPLDELEAGLLSIASGEVPGLLEQLHSPNRGLSRAIRRVLPDDHGEVLLFIDQFEELFTTTDDTERVLMLDGLAEALNDERSQLRLIATIRADFYDRPLRQRVFGELLQNNTVNVLPMSEAELLAAITGPAASLGVTFEEGLVEVIIAEVADKPAMLPLLQYALTELYDRRVGSQVRLSVYRELGGVTGALAGRAEDLYQELSATDQQAAHRLFTRLVTPGEGVEDTRRRASRSELVGIEGSVIDAYGAARLLSFDRDPTTRAPTVEVAHEALIREWPRLREWIEGDRDALRVLRHLTSSARAWNNSHHDDDELYRGGRLDTALAWIEHNPDGASPDEAEFLAASLKLRRHIESLEGERSASMERQNRRLRRSLVGVGLLTILALLASLFAFQQRKTARTRADEAAVSRSNAETRRLISTAGQLATTGRQVALLLAAEAYDRDPSSSALGALQSVLSGSTDFLGFIGADVDFVDVAFLGENKILGVHPGGVVVLNLDSTTELEIDLPGARLAAISDDLALVAVAASDSTVRVFELTNGQSVADPIVNAAAVTTIAFSPVGHTLAFGDRAGFVQVLDENFEIIDSFAAHPETLADIRNRPANADLEDPIPHDPLSFVAGVTSLAFSQDGAMVATAGGVFARVWDVESGANLFDKPVHRIATNGEVTEVDPTGIGFIEVDSEHAIAVASQTSVELWSAADGRDLGRWEFVGVSNATAVLGNSKVVFANELAISVAGGDRILTAAPTHLQREPIGFQLGDLASIGVSPSGNRLVLAGEGGASVASLIGNGLISRSIPSNSLDEWFVSNDGELVVASSVNRESAEIYQSTEHGFESVTVPDGPVHFAFAGSPGAFSFVLDHALTVFQERDETTFTPIGPEIQTDAAFLITPSNDGRWLVVGGGGSAGTSNAIVYDRSTGEEIVALSAQPGSIVRSVGFSPDDKRLVVSTTEGHSAVYETTTWSRIDPLLSAGGGAVVQAKYTPDGQYLVTVAADGLITMRDPTSMQPVGLPLIGNSDTTEAFSLGPAFSDDSRWMVTGSDGDIRLWDLSSRELIGTAFPRDAGIKGSVSSNARFAITKFGDQIVVWEIDPQQWPAIACQAAGRNLTHDEWNEFGPAGEPYHATCSQWPSLADDNA